MTRWKTDEVIAMLQAAIPAAKVEKMEAGGDVDTDNIIVRLPNGERIWVAGFIDDGYFDENRSDVDVAMVELTCGKDSRGGTQGVKDVDLLRAYAESQIALQNKGFDVVPSMMCYF